jgi:hypothetical protein
MGGLRNFWDQVIRDTLFNGWLIRLYRRREADLKCPAHNL